MASASSFLGLLDASRPLDPRDRLLQLGSASYTAHFGSRDGESEGESAIPLVLHVIWLDGDLPAPFARLLATWEHLNPEMDCRLWSRSRILALRPPLQNREAFHAAPNAGQASDIARYELLLRFGGVYVDVDFVPLRPLAQILASAPRAQVILGMGNVGRPELLNGFIASVPGHAMLAAAVKEIKRSGLVRMPAIFAFLSHDDQRALLEAQGAGTEASSIEATGPGMFTRVALEALERQGVASGILVLPHAFLSPLPNTLTLWQDGGEDAASTAVRAAEMAAVDGITVAVHTWARSWQAGAQCVGEAPGGTSDALR